MPFFLASDDDEEYEDDEDQDEDEDDDSDYDDDDDDDSDDDDDDDDSDDDDADDVVSTRTYGRSGPSRNPDQFEPYVATVAMSALPDNVSYEYLFPEIENQGDSPCCVAFAVTALAEAMLHKRTGQHLALSKRALYSLAKHKYEPDDLNEDGLADDSALAVLRDIGHAFEADYPFGTPSRADLIRPVPENVIHRAHDLKAFLRVEPHAELMMQALHEHGPLVVGMNWYHAWEDLKSNGIMTAQPGTQQDGGHCVLLVGYSKKKGAFRLRNSWGSDWGDGGYSWLPFSMADHIDDAYTVTV